MPLETNLSQSPYFDDYSEAAEYYRVLFKPGVSVQVRELNQLQTILQNQIERFGNHVFKNGTIVSGVNFRYLPNYQYVKIADLQVDGQPVVPSGYVDFFVKNSANLQARVVNYKEGYQSQDPALNTLYLQYVNSGTTSNAVSYANGDTLTVFSQNNPVFSVTVDNGGSKFSNSDLVVFTSAFAVNVASGAFSGGEVITQATTGAKGQVLEVNTTAVPSLTIIKVKPLQADLANTTTGTNTAAWAFDTGYNITGNTSGAVASVTTILGNGAKGTVITDSLGVVTDVVISGTSGSGSDYLVPPHVTVKPTSANASVSTIQLTALTYKAQVTVANNSFTAPVGNGYAFAVTDGIIYQKGTFLKVDPQVIIVNAYSSSPNNVSVGFKTIETIESVNTNTALYDNASNTTNYNAPGADRLKMTPQLIVSNTEVALANADFFTLVEFRDGDAYKENRTSVYNNLGQEFARRTQETNGDFIVDEFLAVTKDKPEPNTTHNFVAADPGLGYISGYRVQTLKNTYVPERKGIDSLIRTNQTITANYGNYVRVKELAGVFDFKTGAIVKFYDTAAAYLTGIDAPVAGAITPTGTQIGQARMRSLVYESGEPGTPSAVYKLYLFDISMQFGYNFRDVKSFYSDGGTNDGICDAVQELLATTNAYATVLKDTTINNLLFATGLSALKNANNISFNYRTSNEGLTLNSDGTISTSLIATEETFPYTSNSSLSSSQKEEVLLIPLANAEVSANAGGTLLVNSSANVIVGTTTTFISTFKVGDYIYLQGNTAERDVRLITSIANNIHLSLDAAPAFSNSVAKGKQFFPAFYPIPLSTRSNRTVDVGPSSKTLTVDIDATLSGAVDATLVYNVNKSNALQVTKNVNRDKYVLIDTSNNVATTIGPWSLGVPDAIRLKAVYLGNSTSAQDITKHFYINQGNDGNFLDTSYLVQDPSSTLEISGGQQLLVKFDYFTHSTEGFHTIASYQIDDTKSLANSSSTINTLEIPEVYTTDRKYYDLRDVFDFRPLSSNTAAPSSAANTAPTNPAATRTFSVSDKYFPVPDSQITFDAEVYMPRIDRFSIQKDGSFVVLEGAPSLNQPVPPQKPSDSVTVALIDVKQYPSIPVQLSENTLSFINKSVGDSSGDHTQRVSTYTVQTKPLTAEDTHQPKTYKMSDIGALERRIRNLEYYVSLNLLEQSIKDLVIPSGVTPGINRFKNGFFVDDFDNYINVDLQNKEFVATISQDRGVLQPYTRQLNLGGQFNRFDPTTNTAIYTIASTTAPDISRQSLLLPFEEEVLVKQPLCSSVVNSDGVKTTFNGVMAIAPSTFAIKIRGERKYTPDPVSRSRGGGGGGTFYLCTLMRDMGFMNDKLWEADDHYGWKIRNADPEVFVGYQMWAQPLADWIRAGIAEDKTSAKIVLNIIKPFILSWAEYMAHEEGFDVKSSFVGGIIMKVGYPICKGLGKLHQLFSKKSNSASV